MNSVMSYGRLAWKEYRVQRGLWFSVLVLTALIQFAIVLAASLLNLAPTPKEGHLVAAFTGFAIYMLGCGATLFALEHEHGTFDFQRMLPVTAWSVFLTKVGVAIVSGGMLLASLIGMSHALYIGWQPAWREPSYWTAGFVTTGEVFAWGVFFSLLLRHPLRAAVCALVALGINLGALMPLLNSFGLHEHGELLHPSFLATKVAMVAILAAVDTWLAWRWFHGKIGIPQWLAVRRPKSSDYILLPTESLPAYVHDRPIGWRRLVGITWRQGRWLLFLLVALYIWAFLATVTAHYEFRLERAHAFFAPATVLSAFLFGLCAFTLDQWSYQFRFYVERGANPRWLWLSRHAVWLSPTILQVFFLVFLTQPPNGLRTVDEFMLRVGFVLAPVMIYAISQFFAMFLHSTLIAFVVSLFSAVLSGIWTSLMIAGDIPLGWSVVPIPVVLLFATWYFAPDWLEERKDRRHWTRVALVIGVPSIALLLGCVAFRAYQIPFVEPGFVVDEYIRPLTVAEQETLKLYEEADRLLQSAPQRAVVAANSTDADSQKADSQKADSQEADSQWLTALQPALRLLEQAHERTPVPVTLVKSSTSSMLPRATSFVGNYDAVGLFRLLRTQAEVDTNDGKLSEAWRYYEIAFELVRRFRLRANATLMRTADHEEQMLLESVALWSAHPQQSKDRTSVALAKLEGIEKQEPVNSQQVKINHAQWLALLRGQEVNPADLNLQAQDAKAVRWLLTLMPWEKTRFQRLLNFQTRSVLDFPVSVQYSNDSANTVDRWQRTTFLSGRLRWGDQWSTMMPTQRRAARLRVALVDWRREHGSLPETLQELVGRYFREAPQIPGFEPPLFYSAKGLPKKFVFSRSDGKSEIILPKKTPFLWSPRLTGAEVIPMADGSIRMQVGSHEVALDETLDQGFLWRIPDESAKP